MQYLNEKWLRLFNYYYLIASVFICCLYTYLSYKQTSIMPSNVGKYGISLATILFASVGILYNLTLLRLVKKSNVWLAYLLSYIFFALTINSGVEASISSPISFIYIIQTVFLTYAAVLLGPIVAATVIAIMGVVFGMTMAGSTPPTLLGVGGDAIVVVTRIIGVVGLLFFFKDKYLTSNPSAKNNYVERHFVNNEIVNLLTSSIADGVIIIDKNNNIKSSNPEISRLLKLEAKDIQDLDYNSVLKFLNLDREPLQADEDPIATSIKEQTSYNHELIMVLQNNQELFVDLTVSPITNQQTGEQYGGVITIRDVSKKKQEESARSEFISTASHEMRTPVAAIEGYLGLALNDKVSTIDTRARGYLEKAHASTEHLGRLFQDLLLSAKAEDGRLVSHPQVTEMGHFIEQLVDSFRFAAEKKGLLLDFVIGSSSAEQTETGGSSRVIKPLYYTYVDPDRIRETITNLFDNAVKYTESGKVTLGLTGNHEVVQIFIRDTGPGIPETDLGHLFQKFYRVDNSATRTIGGTGLGLFISRKIIELYKGRIWAESEVGRGSTFYINLPRLSNQRANELMKK